MQELDNIVDSLEKNIRISLEKILNLQKLNIELESALARELKIDQSVAHNGVCLTVVSCNDKLYTVTAIQETLEKTNFNLDHLTEHFCDYYPHG